MSDFQLSQPAHQFRLALTNPPKPAASMAERHRPASLSEMVGQGYVTFRLETFLEAPYSTAFLFEGPTGVGKTTAALAIAAALGATEYGGLEVISSGEQDAESVERVLDGLRYTPMLGSGWKVIIADEADLMSTKAGHLWLSALENLPARSVVIFTTNRSSKFQDRFLDRCERMFFESDATAHAQDAQLLANRVWKAETGRDDAPAINTLPSLLDSEGQLSYRRVIRVLEPMIAAAKSRGETKTEVKVETKTTQKREAKPVHSAAPAEADGLDFVSIGDRWYDGTPLTVMAKEFNVSVRVLDKGITKAGYSAKGKKERKAVVV